MHLADGISEATSKSRFPVREKSNRIQLTITVREPIAPPAGDALCRNQRHASNVVVPVYPSFAIIDVSD